MKLHFFELEYILLWEEKDITGEMFMFMFEEMWKASQPPRQLKKRLDETWTNAPHALDEPQNECGHSAWTLQPWV